VTPHYLNRIGAILRDGSTILMVAAIKDSTIPLQAASTKIEVDNSPCT